MWLHVVTYFRNEVTNAGVECFESPFIFKTVMHQNLAKIVTDKFTRIYVRTKILGTL